MTMTKGIKNIYGVLVIVLLGAIWLDMTNFYSVLKVMLMPTLMALVFFTRLPKTNIKIWLSLPLVFSWIGDVVLIFQDKDPVWFQVGMGAFLLAQIFYIVILSKAVNEHHKMQLKGFVVMRLIFLVFIAYAVFSVISPNLGNLYWPVAVYTLCVLLMCVFAVFRYQSTSKKSFTQVYLGAILFLLSDSILAFNKFKEPVSNVGIWVMATYCIAQFQLTIGLLGHFTDSEAQEVYVKKPR